MAPAASEEENASGNGRLSSIVTDTLWPCRSIRASAADRLLDEGAALTAATLVMIGRPLAVTPRSTVVPLGGLAAPLGVVPISDRDDGISAARYAVRISPTDLVM